MDVIRGLLCFIPFLLLAAGLTWWLVVKIPRDFDRNWDATVDHWEELQVARACVRRELEQIAADPDVVGQG